MNDYAANAAIGPAARLIGAVRAGELDVIEAIIHGLDPVATNAVIVVLAAMVDDTRTPKELLAWTIGADEDERMEWRRKLTDEQCRQFHAYYERGLRNRKIVDGNREYGFRRARRSRVDRERRAAMAEVA